MTSLYDFGSGSREPLPRAPRNAGNPANVACLGSRPSVPPFETTKLPRLLAMSKSDAACYYETRAHIPYSFTPKQCHRRTSKRRGRQTLKRPGQAHHEIANTQRPPLASSFSPRTIVINTSTRPASTSPSTHSHNSISPTHTHHDMSGQAPRGSPRVLPPIAAPRCRLLPAHDARL